MGPPLQRLQWSAAEPAQVHPGLVRVLSHQPADRSATPYTCPDDTAFCFGVIFFLLCHATCGQEEVNLIQMTIISTTVGKNPLEEME